jgi:hypothetical protein
MQLRRYIGIIVSILLIAALLLLFTNPFSSFRKDSRSILLPDPGKIDRIVLSGLYDSTRLVKQGGTWLISGQDPVNPVAVENLLYAAGHLQITSVYAEMEDWGKRTGRSVRFFHGGRTVLRLDVLARGEQFLVRPYGSDRIFAVSLPGYSRIDLDQVFSSSTNHYREHMLIDLRPSDVLIVEVERKGEQPFRFTMDEMGGIICTLPRSDSTLSPGMLDDLSVRLLFSYFTAIRYDGRAGETADVQDSNVAQERWLARLYVESRQGEKHTLQVYSMPGDGPDGTDLFRALVIHNDDPDALVINYIYLDVLMRGLSHYFAGSA